MHLHISEYNSQNLIEIVFHWRVAGALSLGVKQLGCKADHSPPSSADIKE
jgi:hypothetical protein